jgi:hypothetical protein
MQDICRVNVRCSYLKSPMMFAKLPPGHVAFWQHAAPTLQLRLTPARRNHRGHWLQQVRAIRCACERITRLVRHPVCRQQRRARGAIVGVGDQ